jgi:hypothetical protein
LTWNAIDICFLRVDPRRTQTLKLTANVCDD